MNQKPPRKTGLARIIAAFHYSLDGLRYALTNEAAFRQELALFLLLVPVIAILPLSPSFKTILLFANASVLIVELLNSAIESLVDMTSPDFHVLAKSAKDMGSAAVLLSIVAALIVWCIALYQVIQ